MSNSFIEPKYTITELEKMGYTVTPPATMADMIDLLDELADWYEEREGLTSIQETVVQKIRALIEEHA